MLIIRITVFAPRSVNRFLYNYTSVQAVGAKKQQVTYSNVCLTKNPYPELA